jgi:glucosamine--fructose-6-phosphate aminotransferase (isomerizing)
VIADEEERRFAAALDVLTVPSVHPRLSFVLSTVVGHLFGYEAARAIDAQAQPLRASRSAIEQLAAEGASGAVGHDPLTPLRPTLERQAGEFFDALRSGMLNGNLEASTSVRLSSLYRYALGVFPLDAYQAEFGKVGTPSVVLEDLAAALTVAIEELTRPIDAIKHQAKTVTVGISRSDETLLQVPLARAVLDAGAARDRLSYSSLRTLADLDPAVAEVLGSTRYRIEGEVDVDDGATIVVVDRSGIAARIPSRTDRDARLRGTKHRVALERQLLVARGRNDGRTIVIVPEVKDAEATGLTLLHVRFHDHLPAHAARSVLQGYRNRFSQMRDAVMETEPTFRDDLLAEQPVADLLTLSIPELADRWR